MQPYTVIMLSSSVFDNENVVFVLNDSLSYGGQADDFSLVFRFKMEDTEKSMSSSASCVFPAWLSMTRKVQPTQSLSNGGQADVSLQYVCIAV